MGSSSRPTTQTSQVRQEYPEFFKPHLERVLQGAQTEFGRDYVPFPDPRLVETPAARTEALTALQAPELTQFSQPMFETALAGTAEAAKTFPETDLESYMNPYQQLVTDQLLRKAGERRGVARKGISDAAAKAGAFGGSRHGVTEGMFDEATQEQLQDIQDRSDMANFQNALAASQTDKTRGLQAALQTSQLGEGQRKALIEGQIGREKAATAEQALGQQERDIQFQEFQEQLGHDQQKLAEYSSIIRGHTPPPNQWTTGTIQTPVSGFQQAAGLGTLLAGASGFMPSKEGGVIKRVSGGEIDEEGNVIAGGYGDFEAGVIDAVSDDTYGGWRGTGAKPVDMSNVGQHGPASRYGPEGPEIPTNMDKFTHQPSGLDQLANWIRGRKRSRTTPLYDTRMALDMGTGKRDHDPFSKDFQTDRHRALGNTPELNRRLLQNRERTRNQDEFRGISPVAEGVDELGHPFPRGGIAPEFFGRPDQTEQYYDKEQERVSGVAELGHPLGGSVGIGPEFWGTQKQADKIEISPTPEYVVQPERDLINPLGGVPVLGPEYWGTKEQVDQQRDLGGTQKEVARDYLGNINPTPIAHPRSYSEKELINKYGTRYGKGRAKGGPIKLAHGDSVGGSAGVQVYIDKLSDMADQIALSLKSNMGELPPSHYQHEENKMPKEWEPSPDVPDYYGDVFGESTPDLEDVRGLPTFDETFPPVSSQRIVTKGGGPISDQNLSTYMREGSGSIPRKARTKIKEMYESGLQCLAYGGVPGQPYTEDIGMLGGLGAVAGPQMRFAYGGVPGQAYTEDIGMMGGLGAVAGPQLRFQKAGEVEEESVGGFMGSPFVQDIKDLDKWLKPHADKFIQAGKQTFGGPAEAYADIMDYFGAKDTMLDPQPLRESLKDIGYRSDEGYGGLSAIRPEPKKEEVEEKVEEDVWGSMSQEEIGAEFDLQDREHGETGRDLLGSGDETITQDDAPEVVKKKEAVQKEKWGPNWQLIGVGMNLMRGTEAGMKDASALIAKMPTPQDKILAKLKLDYMKMRTEKGRAEISGKWMERAFDIQYKTEEQRRKARDQLHKLAETDVKTAVDLLKSMPELMKQDMMQLNSAQMKAVEKNPDLAGHFAIENAKRILSSMRLSQPSAPLPKMPEEEPSLAESILGKAHWSNWKEGGDIPDPLRQLGVSSIRKI